MLITRPALLSLLCGLISLCVYLLTLAPSITFGDGPELTVAAYQGTIAHSTGYPFYTLLGYCFIRLFPVSNIAYRMNLLSAIAMAVAVSLLFFLALRVTHSRICSLIATLLMAFSATAWSQAVITEVYTLHLLLVVAVLVSLLRWDSTGEGRWLRMMAFLYGLSFTHHLTTAMEAPALGYFLMTSRHRRQFREEIRWLVPLFLAPLTLYLYLPWIAFRHPAWMWSDVRTWNGFWALVTGRQFQTDMDSTILKHVWRHFEEYIGWRIGSRSSCSVVNEFSLALVWLAPWGAYGLFRREKRLFGLTLLVYLVNLAWALFYDISDIDAYFIPSHLIVALWIGCGVGELRVFLARFWQRLSLPRPSQQRLASAQGLLMLGLPLLLLPANWSENDLHKDRIAVVFSHTLLSNLKPNAILISDGENWQVSPLYPHFIENQRPDVLLLPLYQIVSPWNLPIVTDLSSRGVVVHVPPGFGHRKRGKLDFRLAERVIADNLGRRPIYLAGDGIIIYAQKTVMRFAIPGLKHVACAEPIYEVEKRADSKVSAGAPGL